MPANSFCYKRMHDDGQQHQGPLGAFVRHRHDARQRARRLDDGVLAVAAKCVLAAQADDEIEALVLDSGEGPRRIQAQRTQHRLDLVLEKAFQPFLRGGAPGRAPLQGNRLFMQRGQQHFIQTAVLLAAQPQRALMNGRELLLQGQGVGRELARAQLQQLLQARDPDLEEFIQVAGGDAQEAQPLQQRHRLVECLGQNPLIELEKRQLAVDEVLGSFEIG